MNYIHTEGEGSLNPGGAVNEIDDSASKSKDFILIGLSTSATEVLQGDVNLKIRMNAPCE